MYKNRIKMLENNFNLVESKIDQLEKVENYDEKEHTKLQEERLAIFQELRELRRKQYDYEQRVDFEDDR